jgi:hypothetical protein
MLSYILDFPKKLPIRRAVILFGGVNVKKRELNSSPFSNVNPQTHNVRSISDVKCIKDKNSFIHVCGNLNLEYLF